MKFYIKKKIEPVKKPTEAQVAKAKRRRDRWQAAHPDKKSLHFVISKELWEEFEKKFCSVEHGPNVLFTRWIRSMVEK